MRNTDWSQTFVNQNHETTTERHLLSLPPELRNRIYRYAVLEHEDICLSASGPQQPALLRVCTQTRQEAINIYYTENCFRLSVQDYDGEALSQFCTNWQAYFTPPADYVFETYMLGIRGIVHTGKPSWPNLLRWLKACREAGAPRYCHGSETDSNESKMVSAAFSVMDAMGDAPWTDVEKAIEFVRVALILENDAWAT